MAIQRTASMRPARSSDPEPHSSSTAPRRSSAMPLARVASFSLPRPLHQDSGSDEPSSAGRHFGSEPLSSRQLKAAKAAKARTDEVVKEVERRRLDASRLARQSTMPLDIQRSTALKGPFGADAGSELGGTPTRTHAKRPHA
jgi:hypothetical protein